MEQNLRSSAIMVHGFPLSRPSCGLFCSLRGRKDTQFRMMLIPIHQFLGDIHQPLHDEALDIGGNTISVTFGGTTTNLQ